MTEIRESQGIRIELTGGNPVTCILLYEHKQLCASSFEFTEFLFLFYVVFIHFVLFYFSPVKECSLTAGTETHPFEHSVHGFK